jgi:endoglucanase
VRPGSSLRTVSVCLLLSLTACATSTGPPGSSELFGIKRCNNRTCDLTGNQVTLSIADFSGLETGVPKRWRGFSKAGAGFWRKVKAAGFNAARIPLNASNWTGACDGGSGQPAAYYRSIVQKTISDATGAGLFVLVDLHWSSSAVYNGGCAIGQPGFADADHALPFWKDIADLYKSNPAVIFELFNESYGSNTYDNWVHGTGPYFPGPDAIVLRDGGNFTPLYVQYNGAVQPTPAPPPVAAGKVFSTGKTYQVAGMQAMVDTIREEGAGNLILSAPIGWAGEIEVWLGAQPTDPIGQLGASWHIYEYDKGQSPALEVLNAGFPIVVTETQGLSAVGGASWVQSMGIGCGWWLAGNTWDGGALSFDATQKCR